MGAAKNSEAYRSEYSQGCPQALRERAAAPGTGTQIPGPGVVGASGGRGGDAVGGDGNGAAHLERLLARHRQGGERGKGCRGGVSADGDGDRTPGPCTWRGH
ncbi:unnamed protein product [Gadus morhua 'NCC']